MKWWRTKSWASNKIINETKLWIANSKYEIKKDEKLVNNLTFGRSVKIMFVCTLFFLYTFGLILPSNAEPLHSCLRIRNHYKESRILLSLKVLFDFLLTPNRNSDKWLKTLLSRNLFPFHEWNEKMTIIKHLSVLALGTNHIYGYKYKISPILDKAKILRATKYYYYWIRSNVNE